jgi:class 3 adenylate cyclase/predicted ATPase
VNTFDTVGNQLAARLHDHLAQDLLNELKVQGKLPSEVIVKECARLHSELVALTSYIPALIHRDTSLVTPGCIIGAYWEGSVLFADLSGFTALSGTLSTLGKQGAEEVSAIINSLFGAMLDEIHRYQGVLLKFGGDAITAFFDAASLGEDHARLACRAALAMQERMSAFASLDTRAGSFQLRLRIGVHSGRVFAGQVGDQEHIELVVTGRNINRVAMAQEIAEPGEVVVSIDTLRLLGPTSAQERQSGFHLLQSLPPIEPPQSVTRWNLRRGSGDMAELLDLVEQIERLRPYLPYNLPRRFLATDGTPEIGEFRPVTVLFANFFPFSMALDIIGDQPELAAQILNAYYSRAQEVIHRYGGIVNKVDMYTKGDKLMALFGAPVAHEDDPVRATRAALELRAALEEVNQEVTKLLHPWRHIFQIDDQFFRQRIGINTGVVFAGTVGSSSRHEYTVMGQPVNLAARLMSVAQEGSIVLSPSTTRAVERHIALQKLPAVSLKGINEPVPISEVLYAYNIAQELRHSVARTTLVGRTHEIGMIINEGCKALQGQGRVITLVGDAGVGKSRLIEDGLAELVRLSGRRQLPSFFPYSAECQSYNQHTPYAIIRELLRQFFYLGPNVGSFEEIRQVTRRVQELTPQLGRFTPLLGDLLGLPFEETPLTSALTPEQRHDRAQDLVEALLLAEAQRQPLLLIFDDLQWIDASSLDLLARITRAVAQHPLLILLGYRPEPPIQEPWREYNHAIRLEINELTPNDSSQLLREVLRAEPPPGLDTLIEKAQGNPFFIEEVVHELIDSGNLVQHEGSWHLTRTLNETTLPGSIEGVITARLDRIEERYREVLQVASVIGRRFQYGLLSNITPHEDLLNRLLWLKKSDLILPEDQDLTYLFKHALTRDVTYESILYARRRELHRRVGQQIEINYAERLDEQLTLLAHHYLSAEEWEIAFAYHLRAGKQAQSRYANREAITLYERALQIAQPFLESGEETLFTANGAEQIIDLHERLGIVHALIGEYDAALSHYQKALDLLQPSPQTVVKRMGLYYQIARVYEKRAEFESAFEYIEQAMALEGAPQSHELARCLLLGAGLHRRQGRYAQSLDWGERALQLTQQLDDRLLQAAAYKLLGGTYRNLGDNNRALDFTDRCVQLYKQTQDLSGLADAHNDLANIYCDLGRLAAARPHYETGLEIKQAIGDVYGQAMIANNLGDLLRLQDNLDEAIEQYEHSQEIFEKLGSLYATGVLHMNLGATYLLRGDLGKAEYHLQQSGQLFEQAGAEDFLPELERYLAEMHLRNGDLVQARLACESSLANAARLEARAEEGATRRTLSHILAQENDCEGAWNEIHHSLTILREADSPHEIAKSLVSLASLALELERYEEGQAALQEALPILRDVGAQRDLDTAQEIAARYGQQFS